ncbi:aspartate aminotransferase family protein [Halobacterium wangiae]|uniref:aspartate aminotransferase family protein n=1 Tax=Halobacterium wangiae TaxID=2902623 RepID=UPI001E2E07A1|nr:aminotransferase class III-fold pyridoxal phosphate-dependent enzyme [Halobacterium wangiae]
MSGFVFGEKPIEIESGDGVTLYDNGGTEYLDFGASYACAPAGHCHPDVVSAVQEQAADLLFVQGSYPTPTRTALYDRLAELGPGDCSNVWLCNSGTEANEAALKFARHATGRENVVAAKRAFHGRTLGSLAATWKQQYRDGFAVPDHVEFVDYGDADALRDAVDDDTAAVLLEPIQGEGGVHAASDDYLQAAREACDETGAALVFDEIQTGLGRTGELWACERAGVEPDVLTVAKGLGSGLPIGATLCADWIADDSGDHGSTFSGGPVPCAAALATLDVIEDEELAANAAAVGEHLQAELADLPVRDVRGAGLLVGVEVKRGATRALRSLALEHGILALPAGRTVVRLLPPLTVDEVDADRVVDALEATL